MSTATEEAPAVCEDIASLLNGVVAGASTKAALKALDVDAGTAPTDEQRERAAGTMPGGLKGKALGMWIVTGESPIAQARAEREARTSQPRTGSALAGVVAVLADADGPMTTKELYDAGKARGLMDGLKGKTPLATLSAQLSTAANAGKFVTRPERGKYALKS